MPIIRRMHWAWLWRLWQTAWVRSGLPNCVHKLEKRRQDSMRERNKDHCNSHIGPKVFCLVFKQGLSWDIPDVGQHIRDKKVMYPQGLYLEAGLYKRTRPWALAIGFCSPLSLLCVIIVLGLLFPIGCSVQVTRFWGAREFISVHTQSHNPWLQRQQKA